MKEPTLSGKHDDIDLGLVVLVLIVIAAISVALLPSYPIAANIFAVVSLTLFAVGEALFDYHD